MSISEKDHHHMHKAISLLEEMAKMQREKLLNFARKSIPYLTHEDLMQPQDFPELESNPHFRFEEGALIGLEEALIALRAYLAELTYRSSSTSK